MAILTHTTVAQLVTDRPARARVFERLGIDYCCNGDRPLAKACRENDLDPTTVADLLDAAVDANSSSPTDWTNAPLGALIDHIVDTHHAYLRRGLPQLETLLMQVTEAHGAEVPWLDPVLEVFQTLRLDLETHMMTEEGQLGIYRGYRLSPEDRLRRHVIMQLMCHFHLEKGPVEGRFGIDFDATFDTALELLKPMEADGLVTLTPEAVHVRPPGRLLVRNVAMAFDAYWEAKNEQPVHAQTV